ncbi:MULTISPECIES: extracellular solute-binding protein [unclassified Mesorhizobium]|uniref:extracellular solute-binding protein n=1 Tax=unclassified Mesorhizobium TaxID=325217 RepID=UPI0011273175|nr:MULTISPECIES: extracellular solute-binding protein [unclassified Mesorhizobium]MBZ9703516.1 extracellular solute-binding protein [Mesorhizobium sp. CO1-1-3]MBZ9949422.1 extracellular solute-binding protein [Mesorhizobium sp. BR1-1-11]TPI50647.1 extracellular solute-binding protein [Mesorhizobium sp. B3-1-1]TPJ01977.1 extracellular solute-binding protein [Mesorhizobium sp. B2-8-1]TPJ58104.1 extracellular solute-binding protein [Mesorhizobium sp. B2-6-1]
MTTRRNALLTILGAGVAAAARPVFVLAKEFPKPKEPLVINVVDVAGDLQLSQRALEKFAETHPELISKFVYTQAPAPELAAKLKAQQAAGRLDIDFVLTGNDALAAGIDQGLWTQILPDYADMFPKLDERYLPGAYAMQQMAKGQAFVDSWYPSGPLLEYAPDRVKDLPGTAEELLAWCKAHPGKFMYARPANSGPGRTFVMGLPYLLGDKDPLDPIDGWEKTWAYLKELNDCIDYYPSGTTVTMKELGDGTRDIIATTTGWDINPRYLGIVPEDYKIATLKGFHWVSDANYVAIPKGVSDEKLGVLLQLIAFILEPEQQAFMYDHGYMYPGPSIRDVPIEMAPQDSQDTIKRFGRPEYAAMIADNPIEPPLDAKPLVAMFEKWDKEIGGAKNAK